MHLITSDTLRKWGACPSGFKRFCEILPDGATLSDASKAMINDGHVDYSNWLWGKAKCDAKYMEQTIVFAGYRGTATAGCYGTAKAGEYGTATAGSYGVIVIRFHKNPYQLICAQVDGDNVKSGVAYRLDDNGQFVEAEKCNS